jgi:hypothetical protein
VHVASLGTASTASGAQIASVGAAAATSGAQIASAGASAAAAAAKSKDAGGNFLGLTQAIRQVGYVADDLQYGFQSIVNNVSPLAEGLIRGATSAGSLREAFASLTTRIALAATGIQVVTVVGYQLYAHWDKLMDLFGRGATLTEAESMDKLEKATHRTAEETKLLNKYKKEQQEIESLLGKGTKTEEHQGKQVEKTITEAGVADVHRGLTNVLQRDKSTELSIAEEEKALKGSRVSIVNGKVVPNTRVNPETGEERNLASPKEVKEAEDRLHAARREKAKEKASQLLNQATHSPEKLEELMGHVNANREKFPEAFGAQLSYATPEKVKEAERATHDKKVRAQEEQEERKANSDRDEIVRQREKDDLDKQREAAKRLQKAKAIPGIEERVSGFITQAKASGHYDKRQKDITKSLISGEIKGAGLGFTPEQTAEAAATIQAQEESKIGDKDIKKERLEKARKTLPGIDDAAERAVLQSSLRGTYGMKSVGGINKQIAKELEKKGLGFGKSETLETAGLIQEAAADKVKKKAGEKVQSQRDHPFGPFDTQGGRIRSSETFGTSQLTNKVQAGISNDTDSKNVGKNTAKTTDLVEKMYNLLAARQQANTFTIKVD